MRQGVSDGEAECVQFELAVEITASLEDWGGELVCPSDVIAWAASYPEILKKLQKL